MDYDALLAENRRHANHELAELSFLNRDKRTPVKKPRQIERLAENVIVFPR